MRFIIFGVFCFFLISCGESEVFKQRKQQTESFLTELNKIFDSKPEPEQLVPQINELISKYPSADPKLRSTFLEYTQYIDEVNQLPSWWSLAGEGAIKGAMGFRAGPLGVIAALLDSWQDDKNLSEKKKQLINKWEKISSNIDELPTHLKNEYNINVD